MGFFLIWEELGSEPSKGTTRYETGHENIHDDLRRRGG